MDRATRLALRSFPRALWIIAAGNFIHRFGGFVVPMLALYLTGLGISEGRVGAILGAYGIGKLGSALAGGAWTDRFGHRAVIVTSMFSSAAVMLAMSGLTSFPSLLIATLALGFTSELFRPATSALIVELAPAKNIITAFALNRMAINAGFAFGPALAGWLAHRSYFAVFVANAAATALYGTIGLMGLPKHLPSHNATERRGMPESAIWAAILRDRRLLFYLAAVFPTTFVFMQSTSTFALHTVDSGLSVSDYGTLLSLNGILIVAAELSLTGFTRRFPPDRVLMCGYVLLGGGFALTGSFHTFPTLAATVLIWTLGEMISAPAQGTVLANLAPAHMRGRYMGVYSLMWSAGTIVGPWLGTLLYAWRPAAVWWTCAAVGLASAFLVRLALRNSAGAEISRSLPDAT